MPNINANCCLGDGTICYNSPDENCPHGACKEHHTCDWRDKKLVRKLVESVLSEEASLNERNIK